MGAAVAECAQVRNGTNLLTSGEGWFWHLWSNALEIHHRPLPGTGAALAELAQARSGKNVLKS